MTRVYRGFTITTTDTGGRRAGREIWYKAEGTPYQSPTLADLRRLIDTAIEYGKITERGEVGS